MSFIFYNPNPLEKLTSDCVTRALTKFLGSTWDEVYDMLYFYGKEMADNMISNEVWQHCLNDLGYDKEKIPDMCPYCYSVKEFCKDHPYGTYLLAVAVNYRDYFNTSHSGKPIGNHVVCVVNGNYYDTWDSGDEVPIYFWRK